MIAAVEFLSLVCYEVMLATVFGAFSAMPSKKKKLYLVFALCPLMLMTMFRADSIGNFEGMPMGILEAASYGLPCLITEGTMLGESVKKYDAGWVAQTNAESIAEHLKTAVYDWENWYKKIRECKKNDRRKFCMG